MYNNYALLYNSIHLLRPQQWYKNLLIFLPLIFAGKLFETPLFLLSSAGFILLCSISSVNYIINDIKDKKTDKHHPEKKNRPITSGAISTTTAARLASILLIITLISSFFAGKAFFASTLFLFFTTQLYTFYLKRILFLDILAISINFVTRAAAGAFIINVKISPWLVLCTFFLSLYLAVGKRHTDALLLGKKAELTRKTLKGYTTELTTSLLIISTTLLILAYSLYSFLSIHKNLILTIPTALYVILVHYQHIITGNKIARHPEYAFLNKQMIIGMLIWGILTVYVIYYAPSFTLWT